MEIPTTDSTTYLAPSWKNINGLVRQLPVVQYIKPIISGNFNSIFAIFQILERIVSRLECLDILEARLVCKDWYQNITNAQGFWDKIRVRHVLDAKASWRELFLSDLVVTFYCPNYHFYHCNLMVLPGNAFLTKKAGIIKYLNLDKCTFSLATLQLILTECCNLEHLEIKGVPDCIVFSEAIFPIRPRSNGLRFLHTLILKANKQRSRCPEPDHWHNGAHHLNLNKEWIADMINGSIGLKTVKMIGWGSRTCLDTINVFIVQNRRLSQLEELHFENIPHDSFTFDDFFPLAINPLHLRKFSLSLKSPLSEEDWSYWNHKTYATLIIHEIIKVNKSTLEELVVDNCPIDASIFRQSLPKLKVLSILGTGIILGDNVLLMPRLEAVYESSELFPPELSNHYYSCTQLSEPPEDFVEEDIDVDFSFSMTMGKLIIATFSSLSLYLVLREWDLGISSENLGIAMFLYLVIAMISLCANNHPSLL